VVEIFPVGDTSVAAAGTPPGLDTVKDWVVLMAEIAVEDVYTWAE